MEAEVIKLAQAGVAALQAGQPSNWAEIAAVVVSGVVGLGQIGMIGGGLMADEPERGSARPPA